MVKWFVCQNEDVDGPFDSEEIKQRLESGKISGTTMIWGRPQAEWKTVDWWAMNLPDLLKKAGKAAQVEVWHYVYQEVSHGPMPRAELIANVKDIQDKSNVFIWTTGMTEWMPIFENHELIEEIGISRRKHPRADIDGSVSVDVDGTDHIGQLKMVSAGGCGISGVHGLTVGKVVHITLRSEFFFKPLNATAEVRYVTDSGFVGLQFSSINMEEKSAIIDYVRDRIVKKALAA